MCCDPGLALLGHCARSSYLALPPWPCTTGSLFNVIVACTTTVTLLYRVTLQDHRTLHYHRDLALLGHCSRSSYLALPPWPCTTGSLWKVIVPYTTTVTLHYWVTVQDHRTLHYHRDLALLGHCSRSSYLALFTGTLHYCMGHYSRSSYLALPLWPCTAR